MANEREVKYKLTGDVSELQAALNAAESEFDDLGQAGRSITVLENAVASVKAFETQVTQADAKVRQLRSALSEAYAADAEAPQLKKLERDLASAEKSALRAQAALDKANVEVVRLNLEAGKTGVSTTNLAQRKAQLAAETEKVRAKMAALGDQVRSAAAAQDQAAAKAGRLNSAFQALNVRPVSQINAEINKVTQSLDVLARSANVSGAEFDRAYRAAQVQIGKLKAELAGVEGVSDRAAKSSGGFLSVLRQIGPAVGAAFIGEQFVRTNAELENLERTFRAITGSSQAAAKEMEFVRGVADRLGIDAIAAGKAYSSLAAATKGTGVEGKATRDVFEAVARSMSIAGKSAADTEGALQAVSQMASKGVISMEELRQQLGERLPGALTATANGLDITTAQLVDLVSTGRLTADEVFPALTKGLNDLYKSSDGTAATTETLTQEWAHFKNSVAEAYKTIGDAGVVKALKVTLEGLSATLTVVSTMLVSAGQSIGVFFAALANGDIGIRGFSENARQAFEQIEREARDKLVAAAQHNEVLAASLDSAGRKALEASKNQGKAGDAARSGGASAEGATAGWTKLNVVYGELEKKAEEAVKVAQKSAEAREEEGKAAIAVANAFGTEVEKRNAAANAARSEADALIEVARQRDIELKTMQSHLAALQAEVAQRGTATDAQRKVIVELQNEIAQRQAVTDKAVAQAQAAQLLATQSAAESQAIADNSARMAELRVSYEQATAAVEALRAQKAAGLEVTAQLAEAERQAGAAALLYRDAVADQIEKINALNAAKQGEINVATAGIRLAIEQQRSIIDVAKARGEEYAAAQAMLEIKRLEIRLAELTAQAKKAEAEAAMLAVKAKREELIASGQMTAAKEAELKAQEAAAQVKKIEGEIAGETAKKMRELADITQMAGSASDTAAGKYDRLADSIEKVGDKASEAKGKVDDLNRAQASGGGDDGIGTRKERVGSVSSEQFFNAKILERGLDIETSKAAMSAVGLIYQQEIAKSNKGGYVSSDDYIRSMQRAEKVAVEKAIQQAQSASMDAKRAGQQQAPAADQQRSSFRIDINFNGKKTAVNTATQGDAEALAGVLRQLEDSFQKAY